MSIRRTDRRVDDRGQTLIELLFVMTIFSGILAGIYGVLITVQKQTRDTSARSEAVDQARLALSQIDRQVRSGNVFFDPALEALPKSMRVYTQSNGVPQCVQWQITSTGVLQTRTWEPVTSDLVQDWHPVARDLDASLNPTPFKLAGSGTTTEYGARLVDVTFVVKGNSPKPIEVRASLSGRNTRYGFDPGVCAPPTP